MTSIYLKKFILTLLLFAEKGLGKLMMGTLLLQASLKHLVEGIMIPLVLLLEVLIMPKHFEIILCDMEG